MLSVRLLRVPYTRRSHLSAAQTLDEVVCEGLVARIKLKNTSATNTTHAPLLSDKSTSSATSPPLLGHQIVVVTFPSRLLLFARVLMLVTVRLCCDTLEISTRAYERRDGLIDQSRKPKNICPGGERETPSHVMTIARRVERL